MAAIVYEGMVGGGGDLFAGLKFFVLQRIPSRQEFIDTIESNGGEIVKFDKLADITIADHARKDSPIGSISWTFIKQSVAEGRLEDPEQHAAGPKTATVRAVGSAQPPRSGRTAFSAQDDRDLFIWVTKAERNGCALLGNEIYIQLEAINRRHTAQSWLDRYRKKLAHQSRPVFTEAELLAAPGNPQGSRYSNHQPSVKSHQPPASDLETSAPIPAFSPGSRKRARSSASDLITAKRKSASTHPTDKPRKVQTTQIVPLVRSSTGGTKFTSAETEYLIENYDVMADAIRGLGVEAWAKYSITNPNHSAKEWHDYFVQTIEPLVKTQLQKANSNTSKIRDFEDVPESTSPKSLPAALAVEDSHNEPELQQLADPSTEDESIFLSDLARMAAEQGYDVDFEPVICGRKIKLFKLWQVVNARELGGYDEVSGRGLWGKVAKKLNFSISQHPEAAEAIRSAYEEVLPDFEVSREDFLQVLREEWALHCQLNATANQEIMDEESTTEAPQVVEEEDEEDDNYDYDDLEAPPSAPRQQLSSSRKRSPSFDRRDQQHGSSQLGNPDKYQSIDKGRGKEKGGPEIPSTPEDEFNPTPRPAYRLKSSPLKFQQSAEDNDREDVSWPPTPTPPRITKGQRATRNLEPETQDFGFILPDGDTGQESSRRPSSTQQRKRMSIVNAAPDKADDESSSHSQTGSQRDQPESISDFIERHVALGYPIEVAIQAFESTTMCTGNAAIVMEALVQTKNIPENIQGVWTATDDACLENEASAEFGRVLEKHGMKNVLDRQRFLILRQEAREGSGTS